MTYHYFLMRGFPRKPTSSVSTRRQGVADRQSSKGLSRPEIQDVQNKQCEILAAAASHYVFAPKRLKHRAQARTRVHLSNTLQHAITDLGGIPVVTVSLRCKVQKNMPKILLMQNSMIPVGS